MLDLYRVGRSQREEIMSVLKIVRERIFVPYQAALEYQRNRLSTAGTTVSVYDQLLESIEVGLNEERLNKIRGSALKAEVQEIVEAARKDLNNRLAEWRDEHTVPFDDVRKYDPVLKALDELLPDENLGTPPSAEELEKLKLTAGERYKKSIPPGYSDVKNKDDPAGDYLVWAELLEHAKAVSRPLLFVTSDRKIDWYRARVRGQGLGPRVELIAEMHSVANNPLYHQVPLDLFLELANTYLNTSVEDETIETVRSIMPPPPIFDREAFTNMYPGVQWSQEAQDVLRNAAGTGVGSRALAEAMAHQDWGVASSLTLDPEFQSRIYAQTLGPSTADLVKKMAGLNTADLAKQVMGPSTAEVVKKIAGLNTADLAKQMMGPSTAEFAKLVAGLNTADLAKQMLEESAAGLAKKIRDSVNAGATEQLGKATSLKPPSHVAAPVQKNSTHSPAMKSTDKKTESNEQRRPKSRVREKE